MRQLHTFTTNRALVYSPARFFRAARTPQKLFVFELKDLHWPRARCASVSRKKTPARLGGASGLIWGSSTMCAMALRRANRAHSARLGGFGDALEMLWEALGRLWEALGGFGEALGGFGDARHPSPNNKNNYIQKCWEYANSR